MGKVNAIFDLDGTLADCTHRLHYIQNKPKNWDAFFAAVKDDTVIEDTLTILHALKGTGFNINIITGRNETCQADTTRWLSWHGIPWHHIAMREKNDRRPDAEIKPELAKQLSLTPENTFAVFEDRARVVNMWRSLGFTCYQVAEGSF